MNFVTPQEAVHRRNMIVQAQAQAKARAQAQAQARAQAQAQARVHVQPHNAAPRGNIAMSKLGKRNQVVEFITINRKK